MIIDITGLILFPGNNGNDCLGDGTHKNENGKPFPCCCDECDYQLCCLETHNPNECTYCHDNNCPRATKNNR